MAKDPYHYFRIEAREHLDGIAAGILDLEQQNAPAEVVARLLRHAHTLKGAARVVRQSEISELSHRVEELLGPMREGRAIAGRDEINELLHLADQIEGRLAALSSPVDAAGGNASEDSPARPAPDPAAINLDAVRVDVAELDPLLYGIWETSINLGAVRDESAVLDRLIGDARALAREAQAIRPAAGEPSAPAAARIATISDDIHASLGTLRHSLGTICDRTGRELLELQDRALQLRLLPVSSVFSSLRRAVRDAADGQGKQAQLIVHGGENRLDAHVLRALHDALLHLVRNAVSHGIEPPQQRAAAGKPAIGQVEITVHRRGNRLTFLCRDDGRGIDIQRVREAAVARGLVATGRDHNLSPQQAIQLLFRGGVSTAPAVTQHAGRGVGLDVVRDTIDRLKGAVRMDSKPAAGTTVELSVPVSLESMPVLDLEVAGHRASVPFDAVRQILLIADDQIARSPTGDSILFDHARIPLLSLRNVLTSTRSPAIRSAAAQRVVIVEADGSRAALIVDRPLGRSIVILKPLPRVIGRLDMVMGAYLDAAGNPQPVLDASQLIRAAHAADAGEALPEPEPPTRILVIDDSLTSRMLEQSILETAGYQVDAAASGEEALDRVGQQDYALLVVDVEMPGMNGFDFIAAVRNNPDHRHIPAILVTSRAAKEDRARGEAVGAAAYIVKGEFEEAGFLRTIRRLVESHS